jgi:hypothetical protein
MNLVPILKLTGKASTKEQVDRNDSEDNSSSLNTHHSYFGPPQRNSNKEAKTVHYSPEIVVEIINKNCEVVPIKALLETGMTGTLLQKQYVAPTTPKAYSGQCVVWNTIEGTFKTKQKVIVTFKFPEFSYNKEIRWKLHVDNVTDPGKSQYSVIIVTDLLENLGIDVWLSDKYMHWEVHKFLWSIRILSPIEILHR